MFKRNNHCCFNFRNLYNYNQQFKRIEKKFKDYINIDELKFKTVRNKKITIYNINQTNKKYSPIILIIGVIHGNETSGSYIVDYFMNNIFNDKYKHILKKYQISIIPLLNKDNFGISRYNANGVDLNRNFLFDKNHKFETESLAIIQYYKDNPNISFQYVFHSGALNACYPLNRKYKEHIISNGESYISLNDNNLFNNICKMYALYHNMSYNGNKLKYTYDGYMYDSKKFKNGITNEYKWYPINGSINDYAYIIFGIPTISIEATNKKNPHHYYSKIIGQNHFASIIRSIEELNKNYISGILLNKDNKPISNGKIFFQEKNFCRTNIDGTFFRFVDKNFDNIIKITENDIRKIQLNDFVKIIV